MPSAIERAIHSAKFEFGYTFVSKKPIGTGVIGEVYHVTKGAEQFALKIVAIRGCSLKKIVENEIQILKNMAHENIIGLTDTIEGDGYNCVVMPYCPGGDLIEYLNKLVRGNEQEEFPDLICAIVKGVAYLQDNNIINRDIKAENILLDNARNPKICDFDCAKILAEGEDVLLEEYSVGTALYNPHEMHQYVADSEIKNYPVSKETDIYALGALFWLMWVRAMPRSPHPSTKEFSEAIGLHDAALPFSSSKRGFPAFPELLRVLILSCCKRAFYYDESKWKRVPVYKKGFGIGQVNRFIATHRRALFKYEEPNDMDLFDNWVKDDLPKLISIGM